MKPLTNYQIKSLAAVLMVIDHVGAVFFPNLEGLRVLGRLSFPLFCWLLVQGEAHTKNVWQYALRLLVMAAVSQPIFQLTFQTTGFNILFTLLIGLGCLRTARVVPQAQVLTWVGGALLAQAADADYGAYGIGAIVLIAQARSHKSWWLGWVLLHLLLLIVEPDLGRFQLAAIVAPLIVQLANHQPGAKARWFYLFYPAHLLVLYLIRAWIEMQ